MNTKLNVKKNDKDVFCGKRLKECIKSAGYKTNKDFAEKIGMSDVTLSRFVSGANSIKAHNAELFAKVLSCRKEYLLGIDNFKTNDDILSFYSEQEKKAYSKAIEYLETIGFKCSPVITSLFRIIHVYRNTGNIQSHITEPCMNKIKAKYDFSLSESEFSKKYFKAYENIILKDISFLQKKIDLSDISLSNRPRDYHVYAENGKDFPINMDAHVVFCISYKNKYVEWSFSQIKDFINDLHAFSDFCIMQSIKNSRDDMVTFLD